MKRILSLIALGGLLGVALYKLGQIQIEWEITGIEGEMPNTDSDTADSESATAEDTEAHAEDDAATEENPSEDGTPKNAAP